MRGALTNMKLSVAAIAFTAVSIALGFPAILHSQQDAGTLAPAQRQAMEDVVRDYLLKNPAVIRDAMQALQVQEEKEKQARAAGALKTHRTDLLSDPTSPVGGNPVGDITVVEFFDYNCGYCKKAAPALKTLMAKDANVRVVYKEFAILGPQSVAAAKAALAAQRQGKYVEFHQGLMAAEQADDASVQLWLPHSGWITPPC